MQAIHTIALIPNLTKKLAYPTSLKVIGILHQLNMTILLPEVERRQYQNCGVSFCADMEELIRSADMVLTIGGDGTIMHAARYAAPAKKPLLGINMGRLGFVAGLEADELEMLTRLKTGEYHIEKRMMLRVIHSHEQENCELFAINDAVISRGSLSRLIDIDVSLGNDYVCHYRADGLILSTPTGSSAYSLSAGGPVVEPTMQCMVMTPICPHSLFARAVVFDPRSTLTLRACCDDDAEVFLTIDGDKTLTLRREDTVSVTSSQLQVEFITLKEKSFYRVLNDKFAENG